MSLGTRPQTPGCASNGLAQLKDCLALMLIPDIATRVYNHSWKLDPIIRSLLDTDFYKLLMLQMIRHLYPDTAVTFSVINRTRQVRLADVIEEGELRAQ